MPAVVKRQSVQVSAAAVKERDKRMLLLRHPFVCASFLKISQKNGLYSPTYGRIMRLDRVKCQKVLVWKRTFHTGFAFAHLMQIRDAPGAQKKGKFMRKKSHISLAKYMVDSLGDEELKKHKLSFYIGSILPDIKPSFLYKKHEMTGTFPSIRRHIKRLSEGEKVLEKAGRKYYMDLGQISHYLADYFTFPHNKIYPGGLKEHCSYEEKLKKDLRSFIKSGEAKKVTLLSKEGQEQPFHNAEALCDYIQGAHDDYLARKHGVEEDIRHIVEVNHKALQGMLEVLAERRAEHFLKHI